MMKVMYNLIIMAWILCPFVPVRSDPETDVPTLYISIDKPCPNLNENLNEYLELVMRILLTIFSTSMSKL
jgi:hypothetical protein